MIANHTGIAILGLATFVGATLGQTDTTFTYQGSLDEQGEPANGSFNLDFELFDALSGGNQIGSEVMFNGHPVVDGLFTLELDFGALAFDNTSRWIEITVNGSELSPRQPVTRTPYSIQTRGIFVDEDNKVGIGTTAPTTTLHVFDGGGGAAGAIQVDTDTKTGLRVTLQDGSQAIRVDNRRPSGSNCYAVLALTVGSDATTIRGDSSGASGTGVLGWAQDTTSTNYGVWGRSDGTSGRGVYGFANATIGTNYGVYGESRSTSGYGVFGHNTASTGTTYGAYGRADSDTGRGTYGYASHSTGINYGVVGRSNSPDGFDFFASGAGTNYGAFSSRRWKNNIVNIDSPLDKLAALRGVYFDWDQDHGGQHDVGMIAEEVGKVLPEIVSYEENGTDAIGMDYSKMTPLLVEAVNALRAEKDSEIAGLTAENIELRGRLSGLEAAVAALVQDSITGKGAPH